MRTRSLQVAQAAGRDRDVQHRAPRVRRTGWRCSDVRTAGRRALLKKPNCPVIAIEEHYSDAELIALFTGRDAVAPPHVLQDARRHRRGAAEGHGRGRHRHPGAVAHRAVAAEGLDRRGRACAPRQRPARRRSSKTQPTRYAAFAALPTTDPAGGGRRACALRRKARLQGRDDPRARARAVHRRRSATGRSSRAPRRSTCRSICIPRCRIRR